jgi:dihydroxy-acid dehydratase
VREGDAITIDIEAQRISLDIPFADLQDRLSSFSRPAPKYTSGVMAKYIALVGSASEGAVTSQPSL